MDLYLPIAGLSVNALVIVGLGGLVGLLTGMVGVGGGFLTTPILIFYGIPPAVAVASATTQITGTSVSGVLAHRRRRGVDLRMGAVMIAGGVLGSILGGFLFRLLQKIGQIDTVISILYVRPPVHHRPADGEGSGDRARHAQAVGAGARARAGGGTIRSSPLLPLRWRFYRSGLYISPLAPLGLGFVSGMLTVLLGVGGGFIMVPAMIYLLGMSAQVVVGTSLLQILFVTAVTTIVHATTTRSVDIVLAGLLLLGSVIGAQYGARFAQKMKPELLRMILAIVVLAVAFRHGPSARLPARGNLHGADAVSRARIILLALARAARARPGAAPPASPAAARARRLAGADRDPLQLHRRRAAPVRRDPLSGRADAAPPARHRGRAEGPARADRAAREAARRRHLDERRAGPLPLGAGFLRRRLVAAAVAAGQRAHRVDLRARPRQSPALARRRRFGRRAAPLRGGPDRPAGAATSSMPNIRAASRSGEGVLYRARIRIPARVPVGNYTAETFLISDGRVIAGAARDIRIEKLGFERFVANAAEHWSLTYGIVCVALSLLLGWGASALFQRRYA